ncbi:MAG: DNA polymerase III subunit delta' [Candidatus Aminicenantes bacterium]|nr:DNA polymerase III subunit delta' [Candidatus Aminicenantes bacterium]
MAFGDILGNNRAKRILRKALQRGRVPNSLLFIGPQGVGKKETALVLAKAMNCQKGDDACEACPSCRAINKENFPDVMLMSPGNNVHKIDQMRTLKQTAYLKPMVGKKRVFILEDAEKMNDEAANSVLKILEEPPASTHIILITHNPYLILPTIQSRCQKLTFSQVLREDIEQELLNRGLDEPKARIISLLVRGNLRQALNLEWDEVQAFRKKAWQLFHALLTGEEVSAFLKNYAYIRRGSLEEEFSQVLEILSSLCRDLIVVKEGGNADLLLNPDYEKQIEEMRNLLNLGQIMDFLVKIDSALQALRRNLNVNLLVSSFFSSVMERNHV